jgi:subtilisin family serine protease
MRLMLKLLHMGVVAALFISLAPAGTLTQKQAARLHPMFRTLLEETLDANGLMQVVRPDLAAERGAVIYTSDPSALRAAGINVQSVYEGFVTARVRPGDLLQLSSMAAVTFVDPGVESYPQMDVSLAETGSSLLQAGFINNTPYRGEGAIVLIYDTGIDWKHQDFRDPVDSSKSRILAIWDQTLTPGPGESSPPGFSYGVEYSKTQIENEIDGTPAGFVREADTHGHGTHVAGTAAGNGGAIDGKYIGVAPHADIVVVKGGSSSFTESKIIDGLSYAQQKAAAYGKPIVVNMSLGGQVGPHDGTLAEELAVNSFATQPGHVVCISAGNDRAANIHKSGVLAAGSSEKISVVVPSYTATAGTENDKFFLDVWFLGNPNIDVTVTSPNEISYSRTSGEYGTGPDESDGTIDVWDYTSSRNYHRNIQVLVHDQTSATPQVGTWQITLLNPTGSPANFDAWLGTRTVGDKVATLAGGDGEKTVGMPGTAGSAVTIGSYVTRYSWPSIDGGQYLYSGTTDRVGDYSLFSSIGPTADGRQKPDISAPGEAIISSLSSSVDMSASQWAVALDGKHQVLKGTSMAAPHVSGAVALLLAEHPSLTSDEVKSLLATTADGDAYATGLPNTTWGSGKMDILEAMARSFNGAATVTRSVIAYDQTGSGYYWQLAGPSQFALRFASPISGRLGEVQVSVHTQKGRSIVGSGSLLCEVYSDAGGSPGSRIGNAVQVPFSRLSPGTNNPVSLLSANADLAAGTEYFIVLSLSQPGDTLTLLSDGSSSGIRSMSFNGTAWTTLTRNFRIRPVVVSTSGSNAVESGTSRPLAFELGQNYPNPFNPATRISYSIPQNGHVSLKIFDVLGREVVTLVDRDETAGSHYVTWGGTGASSTLVSSGVYLYRLESGGSSKTQKMIVLR